MHFLIWIIGLLLLMLWSGAVWLGYSVTHIALTLPWDQATQALSQLQIPELLKPFIDPFLLIFSADSWKTWAESFSPLMQWLSSFLKSSAGWLTGVLPAIAWIIWALGALCLIALSAGGSAALWFFKKRSASSGDQGGSGGAASVHSLVQHPLLQRLKRKLFGSYR